MWRDDWNEQKFFWIYRGQNKEFACFIHVEKGLAISNATSNQVILCTFTSFIGPESLPIWRKVILLLETSNGILGKINTMICKVGLISPDPQNLWLAWEYRGTIRESQLTVSWVAVYFLLGEGTSKAKHLWTVNVHKETIAAVF